MLRAGSEVAAAEEVVGEAATADEAARNALLYNPNKPKTMRNTMDVPPTDENVAYAELLTNASGGRRKNRSHHKRRRGGRSSKRMRRSCRR